MEVMNNLARDYELQILHLMIKKQEVHLYLT